MSVRQRKRGWYPAAAGSVAGASTASTLGNTWVEAISATTSAIYVMGIGVENVPPTTLDLGTGGLGSEVVATSVRHYGNVPGTPINLPIPVRIPAGTRVAMRHRNAGITSNMALYYIPETQVAIRPYQIPGASASAVANGSSSGTSWVQIVASTAGACYLTEVVVNSVVGTGGTVDVGIGAASSEVAVFSTAYPYPGGSANNFHYYTPRVPIRIPAGTRIAIRAPSSNYSVDIAYVYENAVVW